MQLFLDGKAIEAQCGETLLTLVRRAGLDSLDMASVPLRPRSAAKYIPLTLTPSMKPPQG